MSIDIYSHEGWIGQPDESDFSSKWGLIQRKDMFDGRTCLSIKDAAAKARMENFIYFLAPKQSGNKLYKLSSKTHQCVYKKVMELKNCAERNYKLYHTDTKFKLRKILYEAKKRYPDNFSLDIENLYKRFLNGRCEVTDIKFEYEPSSPFRPSLDRIDSSKYYTMDNVQIVCMIYNVMKLNYSENDINKFISALKK